MDREELLGMGVPEEAADAIIGESEKIKEDYEKRLADTKKEVEIEKLLVKNGARNIKAVRALLEGAEDVEGEIEKLKSDEETRFLFEKKGSFAPARSPERLPDVKKGGYEALLTEARKKGNTVDAIRIKQKAASEGIMLI